MAKKMVMILFFAVLITGGIFAQEGADNAADNGADNVADSSANSDAKTEFAQMAKNTITVDFGPTIIGAAIGVAGSMIDEEGVSSSGFGIAAQYERQLFEKLGVAGRFAYLKGGVGISDSYKERGTTVTTNLGVDISSFSIEGHARFFPFGGAFFLGGMLGYANISVDFSGKMVGKVHGQEQAVKADIAASQGFFKMGAKLGWRISFGRNGGFTFEPAFGYSYGIGLGDTIGEQLSKQMKNKWDADIEEENFDEVFNIIEDFIFIGGPRFTLAFGYRF